MSHAFWNIPNNGFIFMLKTKRATFLVEIVFPDLKTSDMAKIILSEMAIIENHSGEKASEIF